LADWVELSAVRSRDGRIGFSTLLSSYTFSEEEQSDDIGTQDADDEALQIAVQHEIESRRKIIGPGYPFCVGANGGFIQAAAEPTLVGAIYLFCLFLSHAYDRTIIPKALAPVIDNTARDLFQACATVAAAGYVEGVAMSFGWPRPAGEAFLEALRRIYALFGDGTPVAEPRPAAPTEVKDDGVDVIAWKPSPDGLPGTQYLLGQVASGENWVDKSIAADAEMFHRYWFHPQPATPHQNAMFMPFCLEPKGQNQDVAAQELLVDHMQRLTHKYGVIFYRYRIASYAAKGLLIHDHGEHLIERVADIPKIAEWVQEYSQALKAA
jgi:hypothetical protein